MNGRDTLKINKQGHLEIGGMDAVAIAEKFGTPLYVFDEAHIRNMMRAYKTAIEKEYNGNGLVLYASKAFSCEAVYAIARQEGIGVDVVSGGELYTAVKAGFPADKIYMHGNNKLERELEFALDCGVGNIVVDSFREADILDKLAGEKNVVQNVLIRINPGVEAHTHAFVQTARTDSKFGFSIADGAALNVLQTIAKKENLDFLGLHCHIGSQIFELKPFALAVDKMTDFIVQAAQCGIKVRELNMGGGYGVTYTAEDKPLQPWEYVDAIVEKLSECVREKRIDAPKLILEPGRSIVGEAGITLYTVGAIKEIEGIKKYIAVDGGMFENPRYALYQSKYDAVLANRALDAPCETVTVAGKCCESGDMLIENICLPKAKSGDLLAVFTTGAYHYSMASNYNRNPVPPVVLVNRGESEYIVKPQSYEDMLAREVIPARLGVE